MCEKNLDKSVKAVGSDYKDYEYPCLTLEHYQGESGRFYSVMIYLSYRQFADFHSGTCLESARKHFSDAAKFLGVPCYEVFR